MTVQVSNTFTVTSEIFGTSQVRHDRIDRYFASSEEWYTLSQVEVSD